MQVRTMLAAGAVVLVPLLAGGGTADAGTGGTAAAGVRGSGWTQPGANSRHDFYNSYATALGSGDLQQLQPAWHVTGPKPVYGIGEETLPVLADGRAYLGTVDGTVMARNAATGSLMWKAKLPAKPVNSGPATVRQPAYVGGHLVLTRFGGQTPSSFYLQLIGVDAATGRTQWLRGNGQLLTAGTGLAYSYHVDCDSAGCSLFRLDAVDVATGRTAWSKVLWSDPNGAGNPPEGAFNAAAVLNGSTLYFFAISPRGSSSNVPGRLTAYDARTGAVRWATKAANPVAVDASSGTVLARSSAGLIGVDPATGAQRWARSDLSGPLAVGEGRIYSSCSGRVICTVDARTGADTALQLTNPGSCSDINVGGLALVPGRLFATVSCGSTPAGVAALDTTTGNAVTTPITGNAGSGVVLAGRQLYVTDSRTLTAWALPK